MNRIKLYESAIKDLHEVKEKHAEEKMAVATEIAVEASIITGIVVTLLTLAALSPSFVQAFFNVF